MADHIIIPKQTRLEKIKGEVKDFSPQVKQALITASVTVVIALITSIGGCISIYSENSGLKTKVHDLELEVLPFRNLAVQQFNKADAESLKKLAESMTTLHRDYSNQLETINNLRQQIDELRKASEESDRNLFSKMIYETFSTADTNRFFKRQTAKDGYIIVMRLKSVPLPGSLSLSHYSRRIEPLSYPNPVPTHRNLILLKFGGRVGRTWTLIPSTSSMFLIAAKPI